VISFLSSLPSVLLLLLIFSAMLFSSGCGGQSSGDGDNMLLVTGDISFEEGGPPFDDTTVVVRIEDVSRADAASIVVAEQTIQNVSSSDQPIPFRVSGEPLEPRKSYTVSVHVDVDGDGEVSVGDYITTESYPIASAEEPPHLAVLVRWVR
jgi:uncharacterized lipoprotein YbaY